MRLRDRLPARIETDRLHLRAPAMSDLDALVAGINNWKVVEPTATIPFPYLPEHGIGFIERFANKPDQRPYAIARQADDRLIGVIGLKFAEGKAPELGYWLAEDHWGQSLAPEAVKGLVTAAGEAGIDAIRARVLGSNPASQRVLEKTGFAVIEHTQSVVERHLGKPAVVLEWRR